MTVNEMKQKVRENEKFLGMPFGFHDHVTKVTCRSINGRFSFYQDEGGKQIKITQAEARRIQEGDKI